jgi:hypothetical protein
LNTLAEESRPRNMKDKSRHSSKKVLVTTLPFRSTCVRIVFVLVLVVFALFDVKLTCVRVFSSVLWCPLRFLRKLPFLNGIHVLFMLGFLHLFTHTSVHHDVHVRWCSCRWTVTWQVSLVEQGMFTLPEHLSSPRVLVRFVLLDL